jgi:hypothetical protein
LVVIILVVACTSDVLTSVSCPIQCWHNDWGKRDSEAASHNLGHLRCSHSFFWGGTCYCYGPPSCISVPDFECAHNCWHNDWQQRDNKATAAGMYHKRCSYNYVWGGQCYCFGQPLCQWMKSTQRQQLRKELDLYVIGIWF